MTAKDVVGIIAAAIIGIISVNIVANVVDRRGPVEKDIAVVAAMEKQSLELIKTVNSLAKRRAGISEQALIVLAIIAGVVFIIALKILTAFRLRRDAIRYGLQGAANSSPAIGYNPADYMIDYGYQGETWKY